MNNIKSREIRLPYKISLQGTLHSSAFRFPERFRGVCDNIEQFFMLSASQILSEFLRGNIKIFQKFKLIGGKPDKEDVPVFVCSLQDITKSGLLLNVVTLWYDRNLSSKGFSTYAKKNANGEFIGYRNATKSSEGEIMPCIYIEPNQALNTGEGLGGSLTTFIRYKIICNVSDTYTQGEVAVWNDTSAKGMSSVNIIYKAFTTILGNLIECAKSGYGIESMDKPFTIHEIHGKALSEFQFKSFSNTKHVFCFDAIKLAPDGEEWESYFAPILCNINEKPNSVKYMDNKRLKQIKKNGYRCKFCTYP